MTRFPVGDHVFTVGHSTRDFDDVLALLRANEVTHLVDVRSFPSSRIPKLGGRPYTPKGVRSVNGAWRVKAFLDYADYMATPGFAAGLAELLALADHGRPAILCSEAVPWRCHRLLWRHRRADRRGASTGGAGGGGTHGAERSEQPKCSPAALTNVTVAAPDFAGRLPGDQGNRRVARAALERAQRLS